jgi:hypothetical protein
MEESLRRLALEGFLRSFKAEKSSDWNSSAIPEMKISGIFFTKLSTLTLIE